MFTTLFQIGALIIGLVLVAGVLRLILRVAWRIISFVLTLVVLLGAALIIMRFVQIH
jgi:hypothetical protein